VVKIQRSRGRLVDLYFHKKSEFFSGIYSGKSTAERAFVFVVGGDGADELSALRDGSRHLGESQHAVQNTAREQFLRAAGVTQ